MISRTIEGALTQALQGLSLAVDSVVLEHPTDMTQGDYATNVAMALAKRVGMNPKELAEKIVTELGKHPMPEIEKIEVAGPGFINFYLSKDFYTKSIREIVQKASDFGKSDALAGKKIMVEYTQPNPFKPFHIGHLMSNAIGESLARVVEFSGANTIRANYQGDIGPHVAKAIYGLLKHPIPETISSTASQANYIGEQYTMSATLYKDDEAIKKEIDEINKKLYDKSDPELNALYDRGRSVTLAAFEDIYNILGTKFDYYFFESEVAPIGMDIVKENTGTIFEESDGAIVFHGENYDTKLHTRVFINSQGLPTYETKELGLTKKKFELVDLDLSIVDTATEQADYMRVVLKAISLLYPELASKLKHTTHGMMRFASGKMSSRLGNVVTGESLIRDCKAMVYEKMKDRDFADADKEAISEQVAVAAIKYSILRSSVGSDIVYDFDKSISFEGDSGPYLQYTAVRANSILAKAGVSEGEYESLGVPLERHLYRFPEVVARARAEYQPHHIVTYLTELAAAFNSFYANNMILDQADPLSAHRVVLTRAFVQTMHNGLGLLGMAIPEKM